ncbi:MAG TPA: flavodoxin [Candidatus Intestinimonas stercoravium]|uniref:flavodoxin n=1 Tax=uncultured Intestinimonas sp. TaxID=1689265 RepID=UPI001FA4A886|nr:flavodoxin [uncultured Intestinimonas sp.]HJA63765.1 flavodoxin [Candidatus Intestinimonas stercoravium]
MSKMSIIYWSQTGNTAAMAQAIAEGAQSAGAEVSLLEVSQAGAADVIGSDLVAFGCPAMGMEVLEESEFDPFFATVEGSLSGKKVALFGSYGWGDGQWMRDWWERTEKDGAKLYGGEGLMINETPDDSGLEQCRAFGKGFAAF